MASKVPEYKICGKNTKIVVLNAATFSAEKHTQIVKINKDMYKNQLTGKYKQFVSMLNNTIASSENGASKVVYIRFAPIKLKRAPIFKWNEKSKEAGYYSGPDDPKRANLLIVIDPEDPGCKQLEKVYTDLDEHYSSENFGKLLFEEDSGFKFENANFQVYSLLTTAEMNQDKPSADKNPFKDFASVKIKLDIDADGNIKTKFGKMEEDGKTITPFKVNNIDELSKYINRGAIIKPVIRLKKAYCSKGEPSGKKKLYKCGIVPVFDQIDIINSGSSSTGLSEEYINDDDGIVINPTIPSAGKPASKPAAKPKPNGKPSRRVTDEPEGEFDENERISDDEDVQTPPGDSDEGEENEEGNEGNEGEENEEGDEGEENEEGEDNEEEPEEPPKKPPVKKTITPKKK